MVVVEIGVSKPREELLRDAWQWLFWSQGRVRLVVIVDVTKPTDKADLGNPMAWRGYYEIFLRCVYLSSGWDYANSPYRCDLNGNPCALSATVSDGLSSERSLENLVRISGPTTFLPTTNSHSESPESSPISIDIPLQQLFDVEEISLLGIPDTTLLQLTIDHQSLVESAIFGISEEVSEGVEL